MGPSPQTLSTVRLRQEMKMSPCLLKPRRHMPGLRGLCRARAARTRPRSNLSPAQQHRPQSGFKLWASGCHAQVTASLSSVTGTKQAHGVFSDSAAFQKPWPDYFR